MFKKSKKYLSLLLVSGIVLSAMWGGLTALADDEVVINETNFSDPIFRQVLSREFDKDASGTLSQSERNISAMSLTGYLEGYEEIKDLDGIEFFADSLTTLYCGGIGLESLDVSALYKLKSLTCLGNFLTTLDVSKNTALESLDCSNNSLETLVLGVNPNLRTLLCYLNFLENIDLSGVTALETLRCDQNELAALDVSKNTQLASFTCAYNHLTSLDLSANTKLSDLSRYQIGGQAITVTASTDGSAIFIPLSVADDKNVMSVQSSAGTSLSYADSNIRANDISDIDDGVTYNYSVGLSGAESMDVFVSVIRNFYQVTFYGSQEMTDVVDKKFVEPNASVQAPSVNPPECSKLDSWSADLANITDDISVYPVWTESHSYSVSDFKDNTATISCTQCGTSYTVNFTDCINKTVGDQGYCEYLDVVADGVINAKDYAELTKMF